MSRRRSREHLDMDLTSLIDVVFILLIFFMTTTVFKKEELKLSLTLPMTSEGEASTELPQVLKIALDKEARLFLNSKEMSVEALTAELVKNKEKNPPVEFRIDQSVRYEKIVEILDLLKSQGLVNLELITMEKK